MMAEYSPPDATAFRFGRALWTSGVKLVCYTGYWLADSIRNMIANCQKNKCMGSRRLIVSPPTLAERIKADLEKMKGEDFKRKCKDLFKEEGSSSEVDDDLEEGEVTNQYLDHYMFYRFQREGLNMKRRPTFPVGSSIYTRY